MKKILPLARSTPRAQHATQLILASASPRRAELLARAGIPFAVQVSEAREPARKPAAIPTELWPACLAYVKAAAVQRQLERKRSKDVGGIILGADTIVVSPAGAILNKAADRAHARRILAALSGKTHRVITGLCLLRGGTFRVASATAVCRMKTLSERELTRYLESGLWRGKAGAYGIQDAVDDPFITLVSGEFSTVVGLPLELLRRELAAFPETAA